MRLLHHIGIKSAAVILAAGGLGVGLIGSGVRATFTDSGAATETIAVGTMGILVSSTTPGAVVVNAGNGVHTVTFSAPTIQSSAAGSVPLQFSVSLAAGSMPVVVHVAQGPAPASPFSDLMSPAPADVTLNSGAPSQSYSGGIGWTTLGNANEGQSVSVTYTITATA